MKRNNQTTSTKCQYQAAASNPEWWLEVKCCFIARNKHTSKKIVPINTWIPWNPVKTKKRAPYTLSDTLKLVSEYSQACKQAKYTPNETVKPKDTMNSKEFCAIKEWWLQVTVTPEDNNTTVFSKGIPQGESGVIPRGGHTAPISILGLNLLWKKAQKKEKKKRTSERIKKRTPKRIPLLKIVVW